MLARVDASLQTAAPTVAVAYVLTDYPRLAMTFITGEIDEIRRTGGRVLPIAMNRPLDADLVTVEGREREQECLYLKSAGVIGAFLRIFGRHPLGVARVALMAVRSAGSDGGRIVRRLAHVAYAALIVEYCRAEGVRHLHAHFGNPPGTIAWFAASLGNLASDEQWTWSMTIHGSHDFTNDAEARLDLKVAAADAVVTISDFTRSQVLIHCRPEDWPKVSVVRCGIDLDSFSYRDGAPQGTVPVVTTVGRLSAEKGQAVLLEAMAMLRDRGVSARAQLIGDGPLREHLHAMIQELELGDRVDLVGELAPSDVVRTLRESAVFCLPSFAEGLPIAMMEAMAIGVPVVTTHVSGIPELAVDHESALTVAPADPTALADALALTLGDPAAAEQRARTARRLVEENHSRAKNVATLCTLFARLGTTGA
jgi:colanic acid/amylovoran biosynthesis glycosyltransferase